VTPLIPPKVSTQQRAALNVIPSAESLHTRINQALAALARGVRWARGSILNLIV
jgi:hypothetical protein